MTWTDEQIAAYENLEAAIERMIAVGDSFNNGEFLSGFIVIVSGIRPLKGSELYEADDDDDGSCSSSAYFYKRGQHPLLTRGMAHNFLQRLCE
jgi:hypothetical protein